jgi:hypothetical protein
MFRLHSIVVALASALLCSRAPQALADDNSVLVAKERTNAYAVTVRQLGSKPLPLQSVRIQCDIKQTPGVDRPAGFRSHFCPDTALVLRYWRPLQPHLGALPENFTEDDKRYPYEILKHDPLRSANPLLVHYFYRLDEQGPRSWAFNPDEGISFSFSVSAVWEHPHVQRILFPRAGTEGVGSYTFRFAWAADSNEFTQNISGPLTIGLRVPEGDDLTLYKQLRDDYELLRAMLPSLSWHPGVLGDQRCLFKLGHIVREHPTSSYADYARYALIRSRLFEGTTLRLKRHLTSLSAKEGFDFLKEFDKIDLDRFPESPWVLVLKRRLCTSFRVGQYGVTEPDVVNFQKLADEAAAELDRRFPHDIARYADLAYRLTQEEWFKLDPRGPKKIANQDPVDKQPKATATP